MAERKRNKEIHFYVTDEERKLIRRKMIESKTKNMGAYLRKMAIDGYIVNTDTTPLKKQYEEMHKIGININQIACLLYQLPTAPSLRHRKKWLSSLFPEYWLLGSYDTGYTYHEGRYLSLALDMGHLFLDRWLITQRCLPVCLDRITLDTEQLKC